MQAIPPRRILIIFNPAAGHRRRARLDRVIAAVRALGCSVEVAETSWPGQAESIARDAAATVDVIAAAGGDGTINEIINGLDAKVIDIGIVPLGTANVLAREIGLGLGTKTVARTLAFGMPRPIHVGRANGRRFVMMLGVGFDANVVADVSLRLKTRFGSLAYVLQAIKHALGNPSEPCEITIDGTSYRASSVVVCNGRRYGGRFVAAPAAVLADDQFNVVLMSGRGVLSVLRYGLGLILGRLTMWRDVQIVRGRDVVVRGAAGQPVQADGDIVARLPVHVTTDHAVVRVLYPG